MNNPKSHLIQCKSKVRIQNKNINFSSYYYCNYIFFFIFQDNVFQCTLEQSYRDVTCNKADLLISYVDNVISSPSTGFFFFNNFSFLFLQIIYNNTLTKIYLQIHCIFCLNRPQHQVIFFYLINLNNLAFVNSFNNAKKFFQMS